jgi:hypothetical protein
MSLFLARKMMFTRAPAATLTSSYSQSTAAAAAAATPGLAHTVTTFSSSSRNLCSSSSPPKKHLHIEDWQKAQVKPNAFYEEQAVLRNYFYHIDLSGRLFNEEVTPKNIATSLKADKFLDFFFKRLRRNDTGEFTDYPYFSPCGKEKNFILPADVGVAFHDYNEASNELMWGGTLKTIFEPASLAFSKRTGRMYHYCPAKKEYALVKSSVAVAFAANIEIEEGDDGESVYYYNSSEDEALKLKLAALPEEEEPIWGFEEDEEAD